MWGSIGVCHLNDKVHEFSLWDRRPLKCTSNSGIVGFKLIFEETVPQNLLSPADIATWFPKIVCAVASGGFEHVVVPLQMLNHFVLAHANYLLFIPGVHFDFPLVSHYLDQLEDKTPWNCWQEFVNQNRMRDPIILDTLLRLAESDEASFFRPLDQILETYHPGFKKEDTPPTPSVVSSENFFGNPFVIQGIRNIIALVPIYSVMLSNAMQYMELYDEVYDFALERYGPLSEGIQVKGALALGQISVNGMAVDTQQKKQVEERTLQTMTQSIEDILAEPAYAGLFKVKGEKNGKPLVEWDQEQGRPSIVQDKLQEILTNVIKEIDENHKVDIIIPKTEGKYPLTRKVWADYEKYHPFLKSWLQLEQAMYYQTVLNQVTGSEAHPLYTPLVRNGRTSCSSPPIQQTPRTGGFREMFIPHPGFVFVIIDYNYIELCTLAIVCEIRYGFSTLANTIRQGIDPHSYTASIFERVSFQEFMFWQNHPNEELRVRYKTRRQQAKAINFGIPSGLQAAGLSHYAATSYGVTMTHDEAVLFRNMLIYQVYPELASYLQDCNLETLADNLGCSMNQLIRKLSWSKDSTPNPEKEAKIAGGVRNIIRGKTTKPDGTKYKPQFVEKVWRGLDELAQTPEVFKTIYDAKREGSEELFKALLGQHVTTLTGRVRGKVGFTQAYNTPFSGLAADGAKLALWNLTQVGFRVQAFIHDEFVIEIPEDSNWDEEVALINQIVCNSMAELTGTIPIKCSLAVSKVWSKEAVAVYDPSGRIQLWEQKTE